MASITVDATTEEMGEVAGAMGIELAVPDPQRVATENATETVTKEEPVVGEPSAPIASWQANGAKFLKNFYKEVQQTAHQVHAPTKGGRTDATVQAMNNPDITTTPGIFPEPEPVTIPEMSDEEVLNLLSTKATDPTDDESYVMNFKTLEDNEIAGIMAKLAEVNKKSVDEQRRGVMSVEATELAAKLLRSDPAFVEETLNMQAGTALPAEKLLAVGQMVELLLKDIQVLSRKAGSDPEAMEASKKYVQMFERLYRSFMGARAEQGRGLNILQHINTEGDNRAAQLSAMLQQKEFGLTDEAIIKTLAATETPQETSEVLIASRPSMWDQTLDAAFEVRMNGMLSGGTTHLVNFVGSFVRTGADVVDTQIGAFFNRSDPNFDKIAMGEAKTKLYSLLFAQQRAWEAAKRAWKTGEKYGDVDKLDEPEYAPKITGENYGLEGAAGKTVDFIGNIIRVPTQRLMGATDAYNKYMAEQSSLAGQAYSRMVNITKQNPDLDETAFMTDLMLNPTEEMKITAKADGENMTFQEELTPEGFAKKAQALVAHDRYTKLIVPFFKTPANLMKQGFLERTPLGLISNKFREDIKAGGRRAQLAKSKITTGTIVSMGMFMAAAEGKINGHYSKDRDIRDAQVASGWMPMSVVVPHDDGSTTYVPFDRMEPFSYLFGMAADVGEIFQEGQLRDLTETEEEIYKELVGTFTLAVADNTLSKTFMTGIKNMIDATQGGYKGEMFVKQTMGSFIPFASMARNIGNTVDPVIRRPDGIGEYLENIVTLWDKDAAPIVDSLGRERSRENYIVPWMPKTKNPSVLEREMMSVSKMTGDALVPSVKRSMYGVKLTPHQQATWTILARHDSDFVKQATEIVKSGGYKSAFVTNKIEMVRELVNKYDQAARAAVLEEYPDLKRKVYLLKFAPGAQLKAAEEGTDAKEELGSMVEKLGL